MRPLLWRGLNNDIVELPIFAAVREPLLGCPRLDDECESLLEALLGLLGRDAKACELVMPVTLADPELEPAIGHQVDGRGLLGEQHRVVPWQHKDSGAEAKAARPCPDPCQQIEARGDLAKACEMVLDDERAGKAETFSLDVVLDKILEALPAV